MNEMEGAAPEAPTQENQENQDTIFEQLVGTSAGEQGRLQGIVAYGLYETAKREWASKIKELNSRPPNDDELGQYAATWTESRLDGVRGQADQVLAAYADYVVSEAKPNILRDALRGSFGRSFWASLLAVLALAILLAALWVILASQGIDVFGAVNRAVSP